MDHANDGDENLYFEFNCLFQFNMKIEISAHSDSHRDFSIL
jgi:hypothetical protein